MKLNEYPQQIYQQQLKIHHWEQQIEIHTEQLMFMDADIENAIALDKDLKNDQQRKAKRLEMQQHPDYLQIKTQLKEAKEKRILESIYLDLMCNQFSVLKLEERRKIADALIEF